MQDDEDIDVLAVEHGVLDQNAAEVEVDRRDREVHDQDSDGEADEDEDEDEDDDLLPGGGAALMPESSASNLSAAAGLARQRALSLREARTLLVPDPLWLLRPRARVHEGIEMLPAPEAARVLGKRLHGKMLLASCGADDGASQGDRVRAELRRQHLAAMWS